MPHNLDKIPLGYRPVLWSEVRTHELVYVQTKDGQAIGPYLVVDKQTYTLCTTARDNTHTLDDEILLYKKGPLVVITKLNNKFNSVYADLPLEVAVVHLNTEAEGPVYADAESQRPRGLDSIPADYRRQLDQSLPTGYPEFYGQWELSQIVQDDRPQAEKDKDLVQLRITNPLAAKSLVVELVRKELLFSVVEITNATVLFEITHKVLDYITQHVHELSKGIARVE